MRGFFLRAEMSSITEYFHKPENQEAFKQYALARLVAEYDARGEVIPRHSFIYGKLQTDCLELRIKYREMLHGAEFLAAFLDVVKSNKEREKAAQQQTNP